MRLSPVLVAILSLSTALSLSNSASGQTVDGPLLESSISGVTESIGPDVSVENEAKNSDSQENNQDSQLELSHAIPVAKVDDLTPDNESNKDDSQLELNHAIPVAKVDDLTPDVGSNKDDSQLELNHAIPVAKVDDLTTENKSNNLALDHAIPVAKVDDLTTENKSNNLALTHAIPVEPVDSLTNYQASLSPSNKSNYQSGLTHAIPVEPIDSLTNYQASLLQSNNRNSQIEINHDIPVARVDLIESNNRNSQIEINHDIPVARVDLIESNNRNSQIEINHTIPVARVDLIESNNHNSQIELDHTIPFENFDKLTSLIATDGESIKSNNPKIGLELNHDVPVENNFDKLTSLIATDGESIKSNNPKTGLEINHDIPVVSINNITPESKAFNQELNHLSVNQTEAKLGNLGDIAITHETQGKIDQIFPFALASENVEEKKESLLAQNSDNERLNTPEPPITAPTDGSEEPSTIIEPPRSPAGNTPTQPSATEKEPLVLVAEVVVSGVAGELQDQVYSVISTQPGRTTTRSRLQADINAIFKTGYFANVKALPEDTPLGVRVTFEVEANPVLKEVKLEGNEILPPEIVQEAFSSQYNSTLNLRQLDEGIKKINQWYQDKGYVLAQVLDSPQVGADGVVTLQVTEGKIESIEVRYLNKEGEATDAKGREITGRTRSKIITRELQQKPGDVFNRTLAEQDLRRVYNIGIFEDVRLGLEPGTADPRQAKVIVNIIEKSTGSFAAGAGVSSASGLFGTVSYQEQNLWGKNHRGAIDLSLGERTFLADLSYTNPWIDGDPYRTSYTVNVFRRRTISVIFDGGERTVRLDNGDRPRVIRTGGGINFVRPLAKNPFAKADWTASLGLQYQRVQTEDSEGNTEKRDERGNTLTFSRTGQDDLFTLQFGLSRDKRNDRLQPTSGSLLRIATEQSIPIGLGTILFNRVRGTYNYYIPVNFLKFSPGAQAFAFTVQGGTVIGDLPPYEAFAIGGSSSVRGYEEGDLAAARSFILGSIEYRFPVTSFLGGVLFIDAASDLGTQSSVTGNPGGVRRKPGSGYGYGFGVRVQSPLGPIRVDWGFNDQGDNRFHFGIGERF